MDIFPENNFVRLCGCMAERPHFSHSGRGQNFYTFPLEIDRLSGNTDVINLIIRERQLRELEICSSDRLLVEGQLRSFNNRRGQGAKLIISVFVKELYFTNEDFQNLVQLKGTLCKEPKLRCTPMGRDICDLMLAVNRPYGRSDYLPCICWGTNAHIASEYTVGTELSLEGRIQSRKYIKLTDEGAIEKTAYEVSVTEMEDFAPSALEKSVSLL